METNCMKISLKKSILNVTVTFINKSTQIIITIFQLHINKSTQTIMVMNGYNSS